MPSSFESAFAEYAAPALVELFGARDSNGDATAAKYYPPGQPPGAPPLELANPIWLPARRFEDVPDLNSGGYKRRETWSVQLLRSVVDEAGIGGFQAGARLDDPSGEPDAVWVVDEATTTWGEVFVVFGLVRIPLVRKQECRAAV